MKHFLPFARICICAILIAIYVLPLSANDIEGEWQQIKPLYNPDVAVFAEHDGMLYAGVDYYGLLRSADDGRTWEFTETPLRTVVGVVGIVYMSDHLIVYADGELFRSDDQGKSWQTAGRSGLSGIVRGLEREGDALFIVTDGGLFRSLDLGDNFEQLHSLTRGGVDTKMGISKSHYFTLASRFDRIDRSSGEVEQPTTPIDQVYFMKVVEDRVYISEYQTETRQRLYYSDDMGENWQAGADGLEDVTFVNDLIDLGDRRYVSTSNGVYQSLGGGSWTKLNNEAGSLHAAQMLPINDNVIFSLPGRGLANYNTQDNQLEFLNEGMNVQSLQAMWAAGENMYIKPRYLDWRVMDLDKRQNWEEPATVFPPGEIGIVKRVDDVIYLVGKELYSSHDGGVTWEIHMLSDRDYEALAMWAADGNVYLLLRHNKILRIAPDGTERLDGTSITASGTGNSGLVRNRTVFLIDRNGSGLLRGENLGRDWLSLSLGPDAGKISSIRANDEALLAATTRGVFRSLDDGSSWVQPALPETEYPEYYSAGAADDEAIYLAGFQHIIYSTDFGTTWELLSTEGFPTEDFRIANLELVDGALYAATYEHGIFRAELSDSPVSDVDISVDSRDADPSFELRYDGTESISAVLRVSAPTSLRVELYDMRGVLHSAVNRHAVQAGEHVMELNIAALASGTYLCRLTTDNEQLTRIVNIMR